MVFPADWRRRPHRADFQTALQLSSGRYRSFGGPHPLHMHTSSGHPVQTVVTQISDDAIAIGANPPRLGQPLNCGIEGVAFA
jgi:hypothetical protein